MSDADTSPPFPSRMRVAAIGAALVLAGAALLLAAGRDRATTANASSPGAISPAPESSAPNASTTAAGARRWRDARPWRVVGGVAGCVVVAAGLLMVVGACDRATGPALLRLDGFLPMLIKPRRGAPARLAGWAARLARRLLPGWLFSDRETRRAGPARRTLRWLGESWQAAPLRRVSQTACFLVFLTLFFYVCWPYDARPAPAVRSAAGWNVDEFTEEGQLRLSGAAAPQWLVEKAQVVLSGDAPPGGAPAESLAALRVERVDDSGVLLAPESAWSDTAVGALLEQPGPWWLHDRAPDEWPSHYADNLASKERLPADLFLIIDPLVSISTAVAARSWVWSLAGAAAILAACVLVPRGFCGYICPLGTLIDLFDGLVGRRVTRFRVAGDGWWTHIKYYLLLGTMVAAVGGVLVSGFFAAIPVITRGLLFVAGPAEQGLRRGWHLVPPIGAGQWVSIALFVVVLGLGLLRPRFWCKYVCPSGALFSLGNLLRATERKVESSCIHCDRCVAVCPFDAIKPDFTTRTTDCTMCQTCAGVCPTTAIKFVERWNSAELKATNDPPTGETALGRRGFLSLAAGTTAATSGGALAWFAGSVGGSTSAGEPWAAVRPPGSVPEREFLELCIRCGECFNVCPNQVLQPEGFQQGLAGLWTPLVNADWAGCESSCNNCGQVCPTGAIRSLPLEEKRFARMGLAIVDESTCLPHAGREDCDLCVRECAAAGYRAIEFVTVGTEVDDEGRPVPGSGRLAPVVLADACVGCGLCQTRCHAIPVKSRGLLERSAIVVRAGEGREDRLLEGSYRRPGHGAS